MGSYDELFIMEVQTMEKRKQQMEKRLEKRMMEKEKLISTSERLMSSHYRSRLDGRATDHRASEASLCKKCVRIIRCAK